jgi:glycosyltransferase involved in cell wall biosynthesis
MPGVSVIIPCYNAEKYIGSAIESALVQTYDATEVIVVDDGSTDDSLEVIQSYDSQIKWKTEENQGACYARNEGLELAGGTFVKFLDADDMLVPHAVQSQVRQSEELDDPKKIVFGNMRALFDDNKPKEIKYRKPRKDEPHLAYVMAVNPQTSTPLHRRSQLLEVTGFDESLPRSQEYDLHIRLIAAGAEFCYRPTLTAEVRWHDGDNRITNQDFFGKNPRGRLHRIQKWTQLIEERGMMDEQVAQILARRAWIAGRIALRKELPKIAKEYFACARELHVDPLWGASGAYRKMVNLFGPRATERIATWARQSGLNGLIGRTTSS